MDEDERMARLLSGLASDVKYATGDRRFRSTVSADDAAEIAEALARELDAGTAARAQAAARQRFRIACERGCNACCEELVVVFLPEALAVARWLESAANAAAKEAFLAAYPRWKAAAGDEPDRIAELARQGADRAAYEAAHRAFWRRRILCAFNRNGECTIYPVRPLVCRDAHAIGTAERCVGSSPIPAERLTFAPITEFMSNAALLLHATHNALAGAARHRSVALCALVYQLLTAPER